MLYAVEFTELRVRQQGDSNSDESPSGGVMQYRCASEYGSTCMQKSTTPAAAATTVLIRTTAPLGGLVCVATARGTSADRCVGSSTPRVNGAEVVTHT